MLKKSSHFCFFFSLLKETDSNIRGKNKTQKPKKPMQQCSKAKEEASKT